MLRAARTADVSARRLFLRYAVASLLPVLVLGLVLVQLVRTQANSRGLAEARAEATLLGQAAVAPLLDEQPLEGELPTGQRQELERQVGLLVAQRRVLRLRLHDVTGTVVYSDDGSGLGAVEDDEVEQALSGQVVAQLTRLNLDPEDSGPVGERVVEVYEPLLSAESHVLIGVLELYVPYSPIQAEISVAQRQLLVALGLGLGALWLVLLGISNSVTGLLRRQIAATRFLAEHDALTSLPNRALFVERAGLAVQAADDRRAVAVALIDLDRFKEINDTLGHHNGDQLLERLGRRLDALTRDEDTIARLGGDEFGVVLRDVSGPDEATEVLTRLGEALREKVDVGGLPLTVEASIGFALAPADGTDVIALLQHADVAMYAAKREHAGVLRYRPEQASFDVGALALVSELRNAIGADQLVLHYQPKGDLRDGRVGTVEALVRWQHPTLGLLYPDAFLLAVEKTELIEPLTQWVLRRALDTLPEIDPSGAMRVAVNISARSLLRAEFADEVLAVLAATATAPQRLVLEVTETALLTDPPRAAASLQQLHDAGITISIDDFGAGQTSLGYLAALPIDEVKIDKSFVLDMMSNGRHAAIVRSVIELGHSLGFTVTAEGVETDAALAELAAGGCDTVQGYLLSYPLEATRLLDRIVHANELLRDLPLALPTRAPQCEPWRTKVSDASPVGLRP